jgi:hypothetical protein
MEPTAADAVRALRAYTSGHLTLDGEHRWPVRFVWDRRAGRLVFPLPEDAALEGEGQLLLPDEHDPAVAVLLTIEQVASLPGALEIRFEIYHGRAESARWGVAAVVALRHHGEAYDGEELVLTDGLVADEPALCRELNADPARLRALCETGARASVDEPVAVGVDPDGIDIRARFGIVRAPFAASAATAEAAREQIARLSEARRA